MPGSAGVPTAGTRPAPYRASSAELRERLDVLHQRRPAVAPRARRPAAAWSRGTRRPARRSRRRAADSSPATNASGRDDRDPRPGRAAPRDLLTQPVGRGRAGAYRWASARRRPARRAAARRAPGAGAAAAASRSLPLTGSPSAPLPTTTARPRPATPRACAPVGKPAPPRPVSPDSSTSRRRLGAQPGSGPTCEVLTARRSGAGEQPPGAGRRRAVGESHRVSRPRRWGARGRPARAALAVRRRAAARSRRRRPPRARRPRRPAEPRAAASVPVPRACATRAATARTPPSARPARRAGRAGAAAGWCTTTSEQVDREPCRAPATSAGRRRANGTTSVDQPQLRVRVEQQGDTCTATRASAGQAAVRCTSATPKRGSPNARPAGAGRRCRAPRQREQHQRDDAGAAAEVPEGVAGSCRLPPRPAVGRAPAPSWRRSAGRAARAAQPAGAPAAPDHRGGGRRVLARTQLSAATVTVRQTGRGRRPVRGVDDVVQRAAAAPPRAACGARRGDGRAPGSTGTGGSSSGGPGRGPASRRRAPARRSRCRRRG